MLDDGEIDANCSAYDMNFGGQDGQIMDKPISCHVVPGSTGSAYFECLAWTGLFNSYMRGGGGRAYCRRYGRIPGRNVSRRH